MEPQEPKPKKDIGLTTIELEIPETYIDDDNFSQSLFLGRED